MDLEKENNQIFNMSEASEILNVTKHAVYYAIKKKKLPATYTGFKWIMNKEDILNYKMNRYSRDLSYKDNEYSPSKLAKLLGIDRQHIYFLLRNNIIKSEKRGSILIISEKEVDRILKDDDMRERFRLKQIQKKLKESEKNYRNQPFQVYL